MRLHTIDLIADMKALEQKRRIHIIKVDKEKEYMLHTRMENQQDNSVIDCYHLVLHLNEEEFERYAHEARNR